MKQYQNYMYMYMCTCSIVHFPAVHVIALQLSYFLFWHQYIHACTCTYNMYIMYMSLVRVPPEAAHFS